jgi:hypothetical protein
MAVKQIVAGSTARDFSARLVTTATPALPINPTSARLQGKSEQLHGSPIDVVMAIGAGPDANLVSLAQFGNLVTMAILGNRSSALYTFKIKYVVNGFDDWTPAFQYEWVRQPV